MKAYSLLSIFLLVASVGDCLAQSTAFTYQGKLSTSGNPANGSYDIQFKLFDSVSVGGGTQQGPTVETPSVQVTNGVFTIALDFGPGVFDGSPRYLEIGIRAAGGPPAYTTLSPRQPITSSPYAVRSSSSTEADGLSVACISCVTSQQIQTLDGAQITGSIPVESVPVGSANYIQNAVSAANRRAPKAAQEGGFDLTGDGALGGSLTVMGHAGIGAATTTPGAALDVAGITLMTLPNGSVQFGTPNTETGMTVVSQQVRADIRLNNNALKLVTGPAGFVPPGTSGLAIDLAGNVGIGTETPGGGIKLDVVGITRMALPNGTVQFGSPNSEAGMTVVSPQIRADLRLDGSALKLVAGPAGFVPPSTNGLAILPNGNVGLGTFNPATKLHIENSGAVETVIRSTNERAIVSLDSSPAGQRRIWTLESGLFGTPGLFGIYDRTAQLARLTIDGTGLVGVKALQIQGGGDFSENFDISETRGARAGASSREVKKGLLVSIDPQNPGRLVTTSRAYDRSVAGIISGAGGISPGLVMGQQGTIADGKQPVALSGRVWAYCDATGGAIKPGDLLTTSNTPGHAMKVKNYHRAQGAIIGKAMTSLTNGRGLVLVLVSLQ